MVMAELVIAALTISALMMKSKKWLANDLVAHRDVAATWRFLEITSMRASTHEQR